MAYVIVATPVWNFIGANRNASAAEKTMLNKYPMKIKMAQGFNSSLLFIQKTVDQVSLMYECLLVTYHADHISYSGARDVEYRLLAIACSMQI